MSVMAIEDWDPALRRRAGGLLATRLRASADDAHRIAMALAPDGSGPGRRYNEYGAAHGLETAAKVHAYQARFSHVDELLALLETGEPGAIELALEILAELDPEAAVPIAALMLPSAPWKNLGSALGRVLGRCASEESFRLLMDHPAVPYLRSGVATHRFRGGVARAWEVYRAAGDLAVRDVDPRTRVQTEPVLFYLLAHDRARAFPEVLRLADFGNSLAAHALARLEEGRAALLELLARAEPGVPLGFGQELAVKLLLERDPTTTVDALGGAAFLATPEGRPRLRALLYRLRDDVFRIKRGWLASDPRLIELCAGLTRDADRPLAALARDMLATLPKEKRPKIARAPKKSVPVQIAPDTALVDELTALRGALERLVKHLKAAKYRFAEPKRALVVPSARDLSALARIEKKVVVPVALSTFWRIVGSVDLRGQHPSWPMPAYLGFPSTKEPVWLTDPLVIAPAARVVAEALEETDEPPFALHLAPDATGKAGYSGGLLTVWLPQEGADPALHDSGETLLAHLRGALAWGGFPGWASIDDRPEDWIARARSVCA